MAYRATVTTAALGTLGSLPNTCNTIDGSLKYILLGQQTFDAALTTSKVAVPVQLNIARWHSDGRTLWRSRTTLDLVA